MKVTVNVPYASHLIRTISERSHSHVHQLPSKAENPV